MITLESVMDIAAEVEWELFFNMVVEEKSVDIHTAF